MSNTRKKDMAEKKESFKDKVITYFKGVRSEWGKITWPERRQVIYESLVVIGVSAFFTLLVFFMDKIFCFVLHPTPKGVCEFCLHPNEPGKCE